MVITLDTEEEEFHVTDVHWQASVHVFAPTINFHLLSAPVYKPHPLNFKKIFVLSTNRLHWFISHTYDTHEQSIQYTPQPQ